MKTALAIIGATFLALYIAATFGIGNLIFIYSPDAYTCTIKEKT